VLHALSIPSSLTRSFSLYLGKSTSYEAPHYAVFSNFLSSHPSSVRIFSSASCSQTPTVYVLPYCQIGNKKCTGHKICMSYISTTSVQNICQHLASYARDELRNTCTNRSSWEVTRTVVWFKKKNWNFSTGFQWVLFYKFVH
jgi:hypothetical protein